MPGNESAETHSHIREFRAHTEAGAVAALLRESPGAAAWSEQELRELPALAGVSAHVSERGGILTGVIVGRGVLDEAEILNLAVAPSARRQGEGRRLLLWLYEEFRKKGASRVFLEVRESNVAAIAFYQIMGFRAAGTRRDYYQNPSEAATVMELWL